MRRLAGVFVVLLSVVTACAADPVEGRPDRTQAPTGPVGLAVPVELARVSPNATAATSELPDQDGVPLQVEDPFLTITRLKSAEIEYQRTSWGLLLALTEQDGETFGDWTEDHTGEQAAIIVDGEIVAAPAIQAPITGGEIVIGSQYTRSEAQSLLYDIAGR